jgi:phosphohistidine phosphatase
MPRMLFLLRHVKSNWDDAALRDDERPLSERGHRAAALLRAHFDAIGLAPEMVLCSTARRTRETWDLIHAGLHSEPALEFRREIYLATTSDLLGVIRGVSPDVASLMIIGHNPGLGDLADELAGNSDEALERLARGFPTGAFASFSVSVAWADVAPGGARLDRVVRPRELPDTIEDMTTDGGR